MAREMKDSKILYIGLIPNNWTIARIKNITTFPVTTGAGEEAQDYSEGFLRYIRISDFDKTGEIIDEKSAYIPYEKGQSYLLEAGDILAATAGGTVGKTLLFQGLNEPACYAGYLARIKTDPTKMNNRFLLYQMRCSIMDGFRTYSVKKSTIENISASTYSNMPVIVPSIFEQQKIVRFLDIECARIDAVIEQTRASIEAYKKLKQSVIAQAVTRGIHPDCSMKNSGVEWVKEIPSNWLMVRVKRLFVETNKRSVDGSEELLTVSQYTGITPRSQKNVTMFEAETLEGYKICEVGDIAANTMWLWAGAIGVSQYFGVISPSYNIYRQKGSAYNSYFLDYLLRAVPLVEHYESLSTGIRASRLRLYPQQFLNIRFPVPPIEVQQEIVEYLNDKVIEIDKLITKKESFLSELDNYKNALIYEYVTGKKEVPAS